MKDIWKFTGATLLMLLALTLVGVAFIPSFLGDYDWLNYTIVTVYTLAVIAAALYDGMQRGTQDCKFTALMEKQARERDYKIGDDERQRMYKPAKGFIAGAIASSVGIVLAIVMLFLKGDAALIMTPIVRIVLGLFLGVFQYIEKLLPWMYLPVALIYPVCVGVGYLMGPHMWDKQVKMMDKAKRAKRRKKRKVKRTV